MIKNRAIKFGLIALTIGLGSRCSTLSVDSSLGLRAPSSMEAADTNDDPSTKAAQMYARAQTAARAGNNLEACEGFRNVALNLSLPESVRLLARVRSFPFCPGERTLPLNALPRWLSEDAARAQLSRARSLGDRRLLAQSLADVATFEKISKLRVERLQEALRVAPENESANLHKRLVAMAPRFATAHDKDDAGIELMAIANDHKQAREFEPARALYRQIATDKKRTVFDRLKALDGFRMTLKLELKTNEFIAATREWMQFATHHVLKLGLKGDTTAMKAYFDTRIAYARAVWTDHNPAGARRILEETERKLRRRWPLHESQLLRARIAEEAGRFEEMAQILDHVSIEAIADRPSKARFLWYKGWNLRRLKRWPEAISTLELANSVEDSPGTVARNMYWIARIYRDLMQEEKSNGLFNDIVQQNPFNFYALLAQMELKQPLGPLLATGEKDYDPRRSSLIPDAIRIPIDWFVVLGETEVGRRFADSLPPSDLWDNSFRFDKKVEVLSMLARLGQFQIVNQRLEELAPEDRKRLLEARPDLMFPMPFLTRVQSEAQKQSIDPSLIYSIMRQESLFNPLARSPADAFGLMQLIPEMAAKAAKNSGVAFQRPEDLYDPEKNIAYGASFLRELFAKYEGRFILAVASYNANDRAIQGWVQSRMRADPLEFIEEIPYDETRLYVKLVLRNFICYQRRFASGPIAFPDWTLRLQSVSN